MDTRSTTESIEDRLAVVRCVIYDDNPRNTVFRIVILSKYDRIRIAFETDIVWSGRNWDLSRTVKHWRLDHHQTPLSDWIDFGSPFDEVYRLAVSKPGQMYICRASAPEVPIPPTRPDILPLLTAVLGRISDTKPSDWSYELFRRFGGLLAEIMEKIRADLPNSF